MFSHQIENILKRDSFAKKTFVGVFSADQLAGVHPQGTFGLIVNTDTTDQPGRHWQSIFVDNTKTCHFFCSLGEKPNTFVLDFMKRFPRIVCNRNKQQKPSEVTCGGYCIFIQTMMARGYRFETLCDIFESITNDDAFIRNFLTDSFICVV